MTTGNVFGIILSAVLSGTLAYRFCIAKMERALARSRRKEEELEKEIAARAAESGEVSGILNSMAELVIAVDLGGRVLYLNSAAEKIFGVNGRECEGRSFPEVIRQSSLSSMISNVLEHKKEIFQEILLFLPDERVFEAKALLIRRDGIERGALLVLHDITRIKHLEGVRKDFVANVSHELRTPLTSIQGFAETLLDGALSDDKHSREFVQTIHDQAERLSRLVNDLLDLSAIESGRKPPKHSIFSFKDLVAEVAGSFKAPAKKLDVSIESRIPPDFPEVSADRDQLKQVLINLIDNGLKFNKKGGKVTVEAKALPGEFSFAVKDTGMGIPEAELPRVFERFYRVDKGRSSEAGGTGLGLAIVKHIVEAHGGSVRAESVQGEGTSIIFTLAKE